MCCFLGFFFGDASGRLFDIIDVLTVGAVEISEDSIAGIDVCCLIELTLDDTTDEDGFEFVLLKSVVDVDNVVGGTADSDFTSPVIL